MKSKFFLNIIFIIIIGNCSKYQFCDKKKKNKQIDREEEAMLLVPKWFQSKIVKTQKDVEQIKKSILQLYSEMKKNLLSYSINQITKENVNNYFYKTYYYIDEITFLVSQEEAKLHYYQLCCGGDLASEIQLVMKDITTFYIEEISYNKDIYELLKKVGELYIVNKDNIDEVEKKIIDDTIKNYHKIGIHLDSEKQKKLKALFIELNDLSMDFSMNIQKATNHIVVSESELEGLDKEQKKRLQKNKNDCYELGIDYPTYELIMQYCSNRDTRKKLYNEYYSCAYPKNNEIFNIFRKKKQDVASLLGFNNYVELDLDETMAKNIDNVKNLLVVIDSASREKSIIEKKELEDFAKGLFGDDYIIEAWDSAYINEKYKQKFYQINSEDLSYYFETMATIQKLLNIYCQFFDINMEIIKYSGPWQDWAYGEDVYVVRCSNKDGSLIGDILLDLFPRAGKYNHACQSSLVTPVLELNGAELKNYPLSIIVANFNKAVADTPSFLYMNQVETFFHEFGHALHSLFGQSKWNSYVGTSVYSDFVEVPSQLFEFWLLDKKILKMVSSHYKTSEPLPDEIINKLVKKHYHGIGLFYQRQVSFSALSLELFLDTEALLKDCINKYDEKYIKLSCTPTPESSIARFGHIVSSLYGPKYYSYLWSFLYSLLFFNYINKKNGLLDQRIGSELRNKVLAKGGTIEPEKLIADFLNTTEFDCMKVFKDYINQSM